MTKFRIKLNTAKEVMLFVNVCAKFDCDIICINGRYHIDGKSIMGMINFIGKEIEVDFKCSDMRVVELFKDEIAIWIEE